MRKPLRFTLIIFWCQGQTHSLISLAHPYPRIAAGEVLFWYFNAAEQSSNTRNIGLEEYWRISFCKVVLGTIGSVCSWCACGQLGWTMTTQCHPAKLMFSPWVCRSTCRATITPWLSHPSCALEECTGPGDPGQTDVLQGGLLPLLPVPVDRFVCWSVGCRCKNKRQMTLSSNLVYGGSPMACHSPML